MGGGRRRWEESAGGSPWAWPAGDQGAALAWGRHGHARRRSLGVEEAAELRRAGASDGGRSSAQRGPDRRWPAAQTGKPAPRPIGLARRWLPSGGEGGGGPAAS
ncbi:hypothetical protein E2562_014340 [Oryza meyeriana var. granulata]|uniref:Uncharacterized protein n=1 Tax=Oryza meyeriana var. granulata TaxID=110450 RepID=A0A6G1C6C2_9ORYZ|nr:hypothetical protein E2562_014340 [Oryza meyeriana var. granulata]